MKTFCIGGNLKALLSQMGLAEVIDQLQPTFSKVFGAEFKGTVQSDLLAMGADGASSDVPALDKRSKDRPLSDDYYNALLKRLALDDESVPFYSYRNSADGLPGHALEPSAHHIPVVESHGVKFTASDHSISNSYILYRPTPTDVPQAGQIQDAFIHTRPDKHGNSRREHFLVVKGLEHLTSDEAARDPYRKFESTLR